VKSDYKKLPLFGDQVHGFPILVCTSDRVRLLLSMWLEHRSIILSPVGMSKNLPLYLILITIGEVPSFLFLAFNVSVIVAINCWFYGL
jgi:hypothetical protein